MYLSWIFISNNQDIVISNLNVKGFTKDKKIEAIKSPLQSETFKVAK